MKHTLTILLAIIIITGCSTEHKEDNTKNVSEETELTDDLKAEDMLKRDKERYDSMKNAILNQQEE
jgi:PBP1b-binding outer membrane lipoprotein LpoB